MAVEVDIEAGPAPDVAPGKGGAKEPAGWAAWLAACRAEDRVTLEDMN